MRKEFREKEKKISIKEYFDLVEYFHKNLVAGVECERVVNINGSLLANHLKTKYISHGDRGDGVLIDYKQATTNEYNIAFIYEDGSFDYGNEIVFNGTAEKFKWIHNRLLKLEKKLDILRCKDYGGETSNHITLISLQDKLINPIVLVNLYNLVKAYSPAIYWLGSADSKSQAVRKGVSNYATLRYVSPFGKPFLSFKNELGRGFLNYEKQNVIEIADKEILSGLRVEFRSPDGMRVPSALTSLIFLCRALIYKAVELSTKGIIQTESLVDWEETKHLNRRLLDWEDVLTTREKNKLKNLSKDLISLLIPQLKMLAPESIPILKELAEKPVSQRTGKWTVTEKELMKTVDKKLTKNEEKLVEVIISNQFQGDNAGKWKKKVAEDFGVSSRMVEYMMKGIETKVSMRFVFDTEMKAYRLE